MTITLQPNDEIGPYRVVRALGKGGFGAVYEVVHTKLGVRYALKTFALEQGHVELFRKRFLAEGKVLARLDHPNIIRVFDMDIVADGALAYFVMDLVHYTDGESYTMADVEVGGADNDHVVRWFAQLASALDYIHDAGIVHRDIKLNNIMLNHRGGVMLSDFGISKFTTEKLRSEVDLDRTMVSVAGRQVTGNLIMGTEGYMAPEILRGESASAASDTYALGVTFFRLLTGMWYEPGTRAFDLLEPLDGGWSRVLPQMLDADPAKRPRRLAPLARQLDGTAGAVSPRKAGKTRKSRKAVLLAALGGGVLAAAVAAVVVGGLRPRTEERNREAAAPAPIALASVAPAKVAETPAAKTKVADAPVAKTKVEAIPITKAKVADTPVAKAKIAEIPVAKAAVPESIVLPIAEGVSVAFVRCAPRTFAMSDATGRVDAAHAHRVTLTKDCWIATALLPKGLVPIGGRDAAEAYLADLNRRLAAKLPSGTVLRLPTEAEWEEANQRKAFAVTYEFEGTADTVTGKYLKKYAWKSELEALAYAAHETDPHRASTTSPAWVCRQQATKRLLLRPDNRDVRIRLAIGRPL